MRKTAIADAERVADAPVASGLGYPVSAQRFLWAFAPLLKQSLRSVGELPRFVDAALERCLRLLDLLLDAPAGAVHLWSPRFTRDQDRHLAVPEAQHDFRPVAKLPLSYRPVAASLAAPLTRSRAWSPG